MLDRDLRLHALRLRATWLAAGIVCLLSCGFVLDSLAAEPIRQGPQGGDAGGFDHGDWTLVLERFVDRQGLVDYAALAKNRATFDRYLERIKKVSPRSHPQLFPTRDDALAYYLNAYNALVFEGVLGRGPEETSVWRGIVSGYSFFVRMRIRIGGETMNLKSLEDDIVRAEFQDPRIHAALNCASIGCPRLPREAFVADRLSHQLDSAMTEFVTDSRHVELDTEDRTVTLSQIFEWFAEDFLTDEQNQGADEPSVLSYINRYRDGAGPIPEDYAVRYSEYDKRINSVGVGAPAGP